MESKQSFGAYILMRRKELGMTRRSLQSSSLSQTPP